MGVGSRLSHSGSLGTVCYTGEVERTKGTWLGVEWDDPNRGKHSGEHNGKVYFQCSIPGAGSFIRQTAETSFGVTFRRALEDKYLSGLNAHEEKLAPNTAEVFLLGTIEIEAPNFDRVRQKFSRIEKLKELSLDGEGVSSIEADDELRRWCRNVQGLNLSKNLFTGWNSILVAMSFLPALKSLSLDRNRFQTLTSPLPETSSRVTELRLNDTLMSWEELPYIAPAFPKLEALQLGFNRLQRLGPWKLSSSLVSTLRLVFLDGNLLSDWVNITEAVSGITNLRHVSLSSNAFVEIPRNTSSPLGNLKHLVLSSNMLSSWMSVDAVGEWCPALESLGITGNPITAVEDSTVRAFIIARLPSLRTLDGGEIRTFERRDAELFYLSYIANSIEDEDLRKREHPQWEALCQKHGRPDVTKPAPKGTMADRMITLHLHQLPKKHPSSNVLTADMVPESVATLRVLPSMPIRLLRMKIFKTLKIPPDKGKDALLWTLFNRMDNTWLATELPSAENREIDWYGVEDGSGIGVWV